MSLASFTSETNEVMFKVLTLGDTNVGKTSLLLRITDNVYNDTIQNTVGVDLKSRLTYINNVPIRVNIWDTAGQEKYEKMTKQYFKNANGIIIVYDVNSKNSFNRIGMWIDTIKVECDIRKVSLVLVGNKIDRDKKYKEVTLKEGLGLAKKINAAFVETSALSNENVDVVFDVLVHDLIFKNEVDIISGGNSNSNNNNGRISINKINYINNYKNSKHMEDPPTSC